MEPKLLLSVREAADALSISRSKTYELVRSGALPSIRIDGCRRIRTDALLDFIAKLSEAA